MELPAKRKSVFECPELVLGAFVVVAMIAWTLQHSLLQKVFGIDIYETIVWGQQHQWGHSKHPGTATGDCISRRSCVSASVFFSLF